MSAFANRFELRCEPKQHDDIVLQNLPLLFILYSGNTITKNWISLALFLYHQLKTLRIQDTHYTTYKILYDTTNTIPLGARYHVYPVALGRRKKEKGKRQDYVEQYSKRKFTKNGDLVAARRMAKIWKNSIESTSFMDKL